MNSISTVINSRLSTSNEPLNIHCIALSIILDHPSPRKLVIVGCCPLVSTMNHPLTIQYIVPTINHPFTIISHWSFITEPFLMIHHQLTTNHHWTMIGPSFEPSSTHHQLTIVQALSGSPWLTHNHPSPVATLHPRRAPSRPPQLRLRPQLWSGAVHMERCTKQCFPSQLVLQVVN